MNSIVEYLQSLEPSRKIAIAVAVPILLLLAYYVFILGPRMRRSQAMRAHIEEMQKESDRKVSEASQMQGRQKDVEELDKQLKLAITRLPDEKEIPELLSSVSNLGKDSGLDILVFRQKPEAYQEFYAEVPVEMQVRGSYHQVAVFLDQVGKLDRIVNVSDLSMKDPKPIEGTMIVQAGAQVTTFRFLSEAERERLIKEKKIKGDAK